MLLCLRMGIAADLPADSVEFRHVATYGSKEGIHPPRVSNRKLAVAAAGQGEHPYGLGFPVAVTKDPQGRLWISDSGTASVHVFAPDTGYREIRKLGDVTLVQPAGITSDGPGRIYLVDTALANIFVFDEEGDFARTLLRPGDHTLVSPTEIALSEDGRTIYVADSKRNVIVALNREGEVNTTIPLTEAAREPSAIRVIHNQLYVLGGLHHRLEIFSPSGERRGGLQWDGIPAPAAFTFDPSTGRFLVGNPRLGLVELRDEAGNGLGAFGQSGDRIDQQRHIEALYVDREGQVYLVDSHQGKVLLFRNHN